MYILDLIIPLNSNAELFWFVDGVFDRIWIRLCIDYWICVFPFTPAITSESTGYHRGSNCGSITFEKPVGRYIGDFPIG